MSAAKKTAKKKDATKTWVLTGPWTGAWRICAGVGVIGGVAAALGASQDPRRFAFSWLFAFVTVLMVALGALFFILVERTTAAGWSVTVRRTAEFFASGVVVLVPLFIPILLFMGSLFPWLGHAEGEGHHETAGISLIREAHAQQELPSAEPSTAQVRKGTATTSHNGHLGVPVSPNVDDPAGHLPGAKAMVPPDMVEAPGQDLEAEVPPGAPNAHEAHEHEVLQKKSGYLNKNFFLVRAGFYFVVWVIMAMRLFGYSIAQDTTKDPALTLRAQRFSFPMLPLFAITITFAAFDWIMSLEPGWFSTIFGVNLFATAVVSSYCVIILVTLALKKAGPLEGAVTVEHYHDLGKLLFGFLVFWAYVSFAQFLLIWYAALPEETIWYHHRWDHAPWRTVAWIVVIGHFIVPFFWLISRNFKRNLGRLQIGAAVLAVMHVVDIYWFVMPNYLQGKTGFSFHWLDLACLLCVAGIYSAYVFFRMTKHSLIPVGDPRLQRSLHFENA